ncbi:MAG: hypothetical protein ACE37N_07200 [Pseudohongiellaceae bacterium]
MNNNTVMTRLFRARSKLKQEFGVDINASDSDD